MPTNIHPAEFFWREAERLYSMAEAEMFADVRDDLLDMARRYERLADRRERVVQYRQSAIDQKATNDARSL